MLLLAQTHETSDVEAPPDRYFDLIERGFSPETSAIVAEAPVSLADITRLLVPDRR